jgi:predicted  nucleic acid-binding Zn-ribbon protein
MACPTCGHTMHIIFSTDSESVHTCPRCGTTKVHRWDGDQPEDEHEPKVYVPKLVERCRELEREYMMGADTPISSEYPPLTKDWTRLGIAEAIRVPEDRPPAA